MKIKLRPADQLFTKIQRIRFDYTCQKCGKKYDEYDTRSLANLGVSHYFGRSREATRYDDGNVTLLCNFPCHHQWEGEKRLEYLEYMLNRLGYEGMQKLEQKAHSYKKRDDKKTEANLKQRLKEIKQ